MGASDDWEPLGELKMIREQIARELDHDPHFRWRGDRVTRIENLSDIVFALALGMLVSAASPPTTLTGLEAHLISIIPITFGFAIMVLVWNAHFTYFRRYVVAGPWIVFLNAALLLAILFYAYPLRFVFDSFFGFIIALFGDWSRMNEMGLNSMRDAAKITAYYAAGHLAIFFILQSMYQHAFKKADKLQLNDVERVMTLRSIGQYRFDCAIAIAVLLLAWFSPLGPMAGFVFAFAGFANLILVRLYPMPQDAASQAEETIASLQTEHFEP